jgi:hypothetical protein
MVPALPAALRIFVAFPRGRVYTALDERSSSLKGIVRSRGLLMEVEGLS